MASAKQRAWRKKFAKMAKSGIFRKRKTTTRRRRTTRKGMLTLKRKRAYPSKRKSNKPRKRRSSVKKGWTSKLKSGTLGKVLLGLGAAQAAALAVGMVAPQYMPIAKPIAALAAGGVPGVAAELVLDQGILGNVMGIFGGQANTGGVSGL